MLKVKKINIDKELMKKYKLSEHDLFYIADFNTKEIGYGIIKQGETNKIEIYIYEKYQGNGYGSFLFGKLLKEIDTHLELKVKLDNEKMKRIILKYNGKELSRNGKYVIYVVPKIKKD
ncbi:MAG TPA: GNAT family N-acetyltransferase [Candidatus Faecimonas gallistercoris]|nr:GNAT family N-acetyltransferase [Candidatus Faecimonas gallistercoris]